MPNPKILIRADVHREVQVYMMQFDYSPQLLRLLRQFRGTRWSQSKKCWYIPQREGLLAELHKGLSGHAQLEYTGGLTAPEGAAVPAAAAVPVVFQAPLNAAQEQKIEFLHRYMCSKRYSASTISTYTEAIRVFFRYFPQKLAEEITNEDLVLFNNQYILQRKLSASYQNQMVNAIKLFYSIVESRQLQPELVHRPKRQKKLPNVLSKEEVKQILGALNNVKHRLMLSIVYACGLRCGELLRLLPRDVDTNRRLLIIRQAKGRKDRIVPLSSKIVDMISEYQQSHKTALYLFEGMQKGERYDERSLQQVIKQAVNRAGIGKPVTLHWLRHSYATHLLEAGTDLRYIQEILGHSSSRTTEIYTHVSNRFIQQITSPFDTL